MPKLRDLTAQVPGLYIHPGKSDFDVSLVHRDSSDQATTQETMIQDFPELGKPPDDAVALYLDPRKLNQNLTLKLEYDPDRQAKKTITINAEVDNFIPETKSHNQRKDSDLVEHETHKKGMSVKRTYAERASSEPSPPPKKHHGGSELSAGSQSPADDTYSDRTIPETDSEGRRGPPSEVDDIESQGDGIGGNGDEDESGESGDATSSDGSQEITTSQESTTFEKDTSSGESTTGVESQGEEPRGIIEAHSRYPLFEPEADHIEMAFTIKGHRTDEPNLVKLMSKTHSGTATKPVISRKFEVLKPNANAYTKGPSVFTFEEDCRFMEIHVCTLSLIIPQHAFGYIHLIGVIRCASSTATNSEAYFSFQQLEPPGEAGR